MHKARCWSFAINYSFNPVYEATINRRSAISLFNLTGR